MRKALWLVALLLFSASARASLLIEPYAGYSLGSVNLQMSPTYPVPAMQGYSDSGTISGFAYGGRVGFVLHHFAIIAGEYQVVTAKEKMNQTTAPVNWTQNTAFATLGFQAPRGFRFMGSYGFTMNADEDTVPTTKYKGTAFKVAIGWMLVSEVAVNAEYTIYKLTDSTQSGVTTKISDSYSKLDYSAVMVNLSFPLQLFRFGGSGGDGGKSPSR